MAGQAAPAVKRTSHEAHTGGASKEGSGQVNQTLRCNVMAENRHHAHFLNLEPCGKVKEFADATESGVVRICTCRRPSGDGVVRWRRDQRWTRDSGPLE